MTEPVYNEIATAADQLTSSKAGGLRRVEDHERLTKLEYIVADHHLAIQAMEREIGTISDAQQQIINNLKVIKHTLIGGILGAMVVTGGYEKVIAFILKVLAI